MRGSALSSERYPLLAIRRPAELAAQSPGISYATGSVSGFVRLLFLAKPGRSR
jgi:hypothetical protein